MKPFLTPASYFQSEILAFLRIIVGALMVYHGQEVFNSELMKSYFSWEPFKNGNEWLAYLGKGSEFLAGLLLTLGLFTRFGAIILIGTLGYITFFVGHGKFWYEDQHPFMFVLFGVLFLFTGGGKWSLDQWLFKN